ncbi:flagellar protein FlaG [Fonticella tunisiensis]|uniref:Flagellar protein FlaG n=1 Tax=Fonticella tunisiensis TaxID=1096341 RepID=A0A4R7KAF7_9CLOT|nr:flagellar protein FlaG [Fonticella tunisiensis]TDT50617.1 flagellar protein FlaG [Fonticella tunisiensis]
MDISQMSPNNLQIKSNINNFKQFSEKEVGLFAKIDNEQYTGKLDNKDLQSAVDRANRALFKNNTHLKFEIHDKTKDVMVKIVNDETGEVLKEIPPEKILDMVARLWEIAGILIDEKR